MLDQQGTKRSLIEGLPGEGLRYRSVEITWDLEKEQESDGLTEFAPTWGLDPKDSMKEETL